MKAELRLRERFDISETAFVEMVIWRLPQSLKGSDHPFKYRLALVSDEVCVLRYDNESGKGDHKHVSRRELLYRFIDLDELQTDFWADISTWSDKP
jgi:hypothetical protein